MPPRCTPAPRFVAGNLEVGARVQALRPISYDGFAPVITGSLGTVLGPALEEPLTRILVRWDGERATPRGPPLEREAQADDVRLMTPGVLEDVLMVGDGKAWTWLSWMIRWMLNCHELTTKH